LSGNALLQHSDVPVDHLQPLEESQSQPIGKAEQDQYGQGQKWSSKTRCELIIHNVPRILALISMPVFMPAQAVL